MNEIEYNNIQQGESPTSIVCDHMRLFGAKPDRDELDPREIWDENEALEAIREACRTLADTVTPHGTQMEDERESFLWGFVNLLDAQVRRLDRAVDRIAPQMRDLQKEQDGTEIKSHQLELTIDRAQNLGLRRDAFEKMRDAADEIYQLNTGTVWRPRHGSHTSQTGKLTAAAIDARDYQRAREDRKHRAHLPEGTLIAVAGGKDVTNANAIFHRLEKARAKYADMVLVHGGAPGIEKIAASWADRNGVHQIICKPDWDRHGKAAPFRRNDELLNLLPRGVIAFPGSGITDNLVEKAVKLGIPVQRCAAA